MELCSTLMGGFQTNQIPCLPRQDLKPFQHISIKTRNKSCCFANNTMNIMLKSSSETNFGFRSNPHPHPHPHPLLGSKKFKNSFEVLRASSAFTELELETEAFLKRIEREWDDVIMPPTHPTRIRIESILVEIIDALNVGLKLKHKCTVSGQDVSSSSCCSSRREELSHAMMKKVGMRYGTDHLEGRNWELILVDCYFDGDDPPAAMYLIGVGKILMSAKVMENYCDSYIALYLGHEVGHGVTYDSQKDLMNVVAVNTRLWPVRPLQPSINILLNVIRFLLGRWYARRMELVADYIGIMLMASAGYDPTQYVEDISRCNDRSDYNFFTSNHPSLKKVVEYLRKMILEEAVVVYQQVKAAGHEEEEELKKFVQEDNSIPQSTAGEETIYDKEKTSHYSLWERLYKKLFP